jgi:hypothetical protein
MRLFEARQTGSGGACVWLVVEIGGWCAVESGCLSGAAEMVLIIG